MTKSKIVIVGAGSVGTTIAYALLLEHSSASIYLVDIDQKKCAGEVMDLIDAQSFINEKPLINVGTIHDLADADIIIMAAGRRQKVGESRTDLLQTNKVLVHDLFKNAGPLLKSVLIIVVTNPVDIITLYVQQATGLPHHQVLGTGTFIDTQRLKRLLANQYKVTLADVSLLIIGEHGDSQVTCWSSATIRNTPIFSCSGVSERECIALAQQAKMTAYQMIACKGSTYYGIGTCVARICRTIIEGKKMIAPLSCYVPRFDLYLSMPVVLGPQGIEQILKVSLDSQEEKQLEQSAHTLRSFLS